MKKILALILSFVIVLSCFAGCTRSKPTPTIPEKDTRPTETTKDPTEGDSNDPTVPEPTVDLTALGFDNFDSDLISYLNESWSEENYMVSPASLKMALALLAAGAETNTLDEILNATGFESTDDYLTWAQSITNLEFDDADQSESVDGQIFVSSNQRDSAFKIGYGIWHNSDELGEFTDVYRDRMQELNAMFAEVPGDQLHVEINKWVDEKTNGLIPELFQGSLEDFTNILVNTVYLKGAWDKDFNDALTEEGDFTTIGGEIVKKELMHQENKFEYYEDNDTQLLIMTLDNGFKVAFVLGNNENVLDAIYNTEFSLVNVTLPKFEITTSFDTQMTDYLRHVGVETAFTDLADFSTMMDFPVRLDSVVQMTKIKVDEDGLEAAAATSAIMTGNAAFEDRPKPFYFTADKPFTFYVFTDDASLASPELLFYGQYVK